MRFLLLLIFLCFPLMAEARDPAKVDAEKLPPVGTKKDVAKEDVEPITPEQQASLICQTADIMGQKVAGPDYVEGVDAYGNPVASANVDNPPVFEVPEAVEVPIAIDVMETLGITSPAVEGKANFGTLTVLKGGKLLYNSKDITNTVEGYCRDHAQKTKEQQK